MLDTPTGIDFGTTNSVVAAHSLSNLPTVVPIDTPSDAEWSDLGFDLITPSVFGITPSGEPVFGWEAKLDASLDAQSRRIQAVKRLFKISRRSRWRGRNSS
jgi:Molecular chaperone